jgi:outer membrane protein assembly factor BamA
MKRIGIFFVLFLIILSRIFSQESRIDNLSNKSTDENTITSISISGLKRTKLYIIENPLQKFIGLDAGSVDINEVIAIVKSSSVVEPLTVEFENSQDGNGKVLTITVKEKWSILPVPFFNIGSSGWGFGGAFIDSNAFGVKDNIMAVGSYSPGSWMATVMFIDSPNAVGDFGWNIMGMFLHQDKENIDQKDEQTLRRYNSIIINPSFGLSYKLTELITHSISVGYKNVMLRDTESPINAPEYGIQAVSIAPGVGITHNTWDGYFLNEKSASIKYTYNFVIGGDDVHSVELIHSVMLNGTLNHSIIPGFRVTAKTGMVFATPSASPFFESSPISAAVNILPQKYSAVDFAGVSLGLEKFIYKFKFGTLALSAAYQIVYSHGALLKHQFDHGPAAMLQMYLSGIAIPAVGLGGAYNVDKKTWQYAASIGVAF